MGEHQRSFLPAQLVMPRHHGPRKEVGKRHQPERAVYPRLLAWPGFNGNGPTGLHCLHNVGKPGPRHEHDRVVPAEQCPCLAAMRVARADNRQVAIPPLLGPAGNLERVRLGLMHMIAADHMLLLACEQMGELDHTIGTEQA